MNSILFTKSRGGCYEEWQRSDLKEPYHMSRAGPVSRSLRSKRFRGAESKERGFWRFAHTETLATQARLAAGWCPFAGISARLLNAIIINLMII